MRRKVYKIKVTNTVCGRVDYHSNLTRWDLDWIRATPSLNVEILEVESREEREEDESRFD